MEITLGTHYSEFITKSLKSGKYNSVDDIVRKAILLLEMEDNKADILCSELTAGELSPMVENFDSQLLLEQIHKKYL